MKQDIVAEMQKAFHNSQSGFFQLDHIKALQQNIAVLPQKQLVIDIGCGTAQSSQLFQNHTYMGADMDFILNGCARVNFPDHNYIVFDAETYDFNSLESADVLLMNAFIDVMQHPIEVLDKVLAQEIEFILLHRQEFSDTKPTQVIRNPSYCGETWHSIINAIEFNKLITKHGYTVVSSGRCGFGNWEEGGHSLLLKKNNTINRG